MSFFDSIARLFGQSPNVPSPLGIIEFSQLKVAKSADDKAVTLTIDNLPSPLWLYSNPYNTDSMDGAYDVGHTPIIVCDKAFIKDNAHVGAWISWNNGEWGRFHQVVKEGQDEFGTYFRTKGVNLSYEDPWNIRISEIQGIAIGILWTKKSNASIYLA